MKKRKDEGKIEKIFTIRVLIILLIFTSIVILTNIAKNLHNIDIIYNAIKIGEELGISFEDKGSDYMTRPIEDYYISSMNGLILNMGWMIFISLFLGYLVGNTWREK